MQKAGGAAKGAQFENLAAPLEAVSAISPMPVDLRLTYERRVLPALFGYVKERSGKATKAAALPDRLALIGRVIGSQGVLSFKAGAHARIKCEGILSCSNAWQLVGLPRDGSTTDGVRWSPEPQRTTVFAAFSKSPSGSSSASSQLPPFLQNSLAVRQLSRPAADAAGAAELIRLFDEEKALAAEVRRLQDARSAIAQESGAPPPANGPVDGGLILQNLAAPLANALRRHAAMCRKIMQASGQAAAGDGAASSTAAPGGGSGTGRNSGGGRGAVGSRGAGGGKRSGPLDKRFEAQTNIGSFFKKPRPPN